MSIRERYSIDCRFKKLVDTMIFTQNTNNISMSDIRDAILMMEVLIHERNAKYFKNGDINELFIKIQENLENFKEEFK